MTVFSIERVDDGIAQAGMKSRLIPGYFPLMTPSDLTGELA